MTAFPLEELLAIDLLLDKEQEANKRERKWVHEAWKKRETEGEFSALLKDLTGDETFFMNILELEKLPIKYDGKI
jgi:hypothetical protein